MEVTVKVPGSCGELVQGVIDGINLHITCPIDLYSYVTVRVEQSFKGIRSKQAGNKAITALKETLTYFGYDSGAEITIRSKLVKGKGMASSTADIVATIIATTLAIGEEVDTELIKEIALKIEPTDGLFLTGIVAFDHLQGKRSIKLGEIDPIPILIFDIGGEVDTLSFNSRSDLASLNLLREQEVKRAYKLVAEGIKRGDRRLIAKGATLSSLSNQIVLFKPYLKELLELAEEKETILGLNIAHSGTMIGVLAAKNLRTEKILNEIKEKTELEHLKRVKIISGGIERRVNDGTFAWRQIN
jgi:L-threonine kinase